MGQNTVLSEIPENKWFLFLSAARVAYKKVPGGFIAEGDSNPCSTYNNLAVLRLKQVFFRELLLKHQYVIIPSRNLYSVDLSSADIFVKISAEKSAFLDPQQQGVGHFQHPPESLVLDLEDIFRVEVVTLFKGPQGIIINPPH